jgi:N-dimethylarginine dimethylaminohydrolase
MTQPDHTGNPPDRYVQGQMRLLADPPFDDPESLRLTWGKVWGAADEIGRLREVVVRAPNEEFLEVSRDSWDDASGALVEPSRYFWTDREPPQLDALRAQHEGLVAALQAEDVVVHRAPGLPVRFSKAIYVRDPFTMFPGGAVVCRMAAEMRRGEEPHVSKMLVDLGVPILRTIAGRGIVEGGTVMKLRPGLVAFGTSIRCNQEGAQQLEEVADVLGGRLLTVPLAGFTIHLDERMAIVDADKVLVDAPGLPHTFLQELRDLGFELLHADPAEGWAANLLTVRPGRVLISDACPRTSELLERRGVEVVPIAYDEIHKNGGGIHCSTNELVRDRAM